MTMLHLMIFPAPSDPHGGSSWIGMFLIWIAPFLIVYLWHWWHDHRHNHVLEKRLKEIVERLDRILENGGRKEPR